MYSEINLKYNERGLLCGNEQIDQLILTHVANGLECVTEEYFHSVVKPLLGIHGVVSINIFKTTTPTLDKTTINFFAT
jgi:hypothetical protein